MSRGALHMVGNGRTCPRCLAYTCGKHDRLRRILVSNVLPHGDARLKAIISGVCVIMAKRNDTGYMFAATHVQTLWLTCISSRKHDIIHHVVSLVYTTTCSLRNNRGYFRFRRYERPFESGLIAPNVIYRHNSAHQNRLDIYPKIGKFNLNAMYLRQIDVRRGKFNSDFSI